MQPGQQPPDEANKAQSMVKDKGKRSPFWIDKLKPIQIATFDLEEFRNCRREFLGG